MLAKALAVVAVLALGAQGPPSEADAAMQAAAVLATSGNAAAALSAYRDLLARRTGSTTERARVLDAVAALETSQGDYAAGRQHADEASAIYSTLGDLKGQSAALNRGGLARLYAGDYREAASVFARAVAASTSAGHVEAQAEQISNLGNVFYFLGRYSDAASAYDKALALAEAHADEPWSGRRRRLALANIATLDQRLGRDLDALEQYRVLNAGSSNLRPREQAQLLANQGVLYRRLGDPVKALATYDQALALFATDPMLDGELGVIKNRGIVMALDQGDLEGARRSFSLGFARAKEAGNRREMLQAQLYRGETERRLGLLDEAASDFDASLTTARDLQTPEEIWKAHHGLGRVDVARGAPLDAIRHFDAALEVIEQLREGIKVPALRSDYFSDKREVYDSQLAVRLAQGTSSADVIFALLERSHSRAWRERLGLSTALDLPSIQRQLPSRTVLLDYWHSASGSAVVVVTHDSARVLRLTIADDRIRALSEALSSQTASAWKEAAAELSAQVLPSGAIADADHVLVVVDEALALVPFEVLSVGDQLLVARADVTYLPTAALLLREARPLSSMAPPWRRTVSAFGDPVVESSRLDDPAAVRARLADSAAEARDIAAQMGGTSRVFLGRENRKIHLTTPGDIAPIVHLATHAAADPDAIEQSRILFSSQDGGAADYLFLREAYDLPLKQVELAVLSACDTERGRVVRGEGVQSFSRAFLAAGARSTVTTLWRVSDDATADFMRQFYYHLDRGVSRGEALRQAKIRFIQGGGPWAEPHVWAAFVLTGDGASPVPRALHWGQVIVTGAGVSLVMAVVLFAARRRR